MGPVNWLAVVLGAVAFFAVGAVWYSFLFSKAWQREVGMGAPEIEAARAKGASHFVKIMGLTLVLELIVSWMLGHLVARTSPSPHVIMMFAFGFGAFLMTPAIGINYLYQNRSLKLFLIDAGHFIVGTAAMGAVHVLLS
ncbi:DUF1761 domain-containing protein [Altererythrobacter sp. Root672]|uniref:DUF1761 domain-containing protein n=1 Tax=Altererythrobacter sp. Root672 TaxID=1736584 RepID=UPI0006FA3E92|nr:DUF1761 domain-containing protein [Altererythrobacter sp. Root672]KRA82616.1 hypothetical protein ASD76_00490 [Altererythrobacter sp. Root672]